MLITAMLTFMPQHLLQTILSLFKAVSRTASTGGGNKQIKRKGPVQRTGPFCIRTEITQS
jgi:hypothetical protein